MEEERKTFEDGHRSMQQVCKGTLDQIDEYLSNTIIGEAK
jgi:hypothetical protein